MNKTQRSQEKQAVRLLEFLLSAGTVQILEFGPADTQRLLLSHPSDPKRKLVTTTQIVKHQQAAGLIAISKGTGKLTRAGLSRIKRQRASNGHFSEFQCQHQDIVEQDILIDGHRQKVSRNLCESPLSRLRHHNDKDGQPWLTEAQFSAGERLRSDFTHAHLANAMTTNWRSPDQAMIKASGGGAGGVGELSDSTLDARQRFNQALEFVGADLSNVLIDVCCYLKGLQTVERELRWPPRSAKLMLRTGLQLLTQFYGTTPGQTLHDRRAVKHVAHSG